MFSRFMPYGYWQTQRSAIVTGNMGESVDESIQIAPEKAAQKQTVRLL